MWLGALTAKDTEGQGSLERIWHAQQRKWAVGSECSSLARDLPESCLQE